MILKEQIISQSEIITGELAVVGTRVRFKEAGEVVEVDDADALRYRLHLEIGIPKEILGVLHAALSDVFGERPSDLPLEDRRQIAE